MGFRECDFYQLELDQMMCTSNAENRHNITVETRRYDKKHSPQVEKIKTNQFFNCDRLQENSWWQ